MSLIKIGLQLLSLRVRFTFRRRPVDTVDSGEN